MTFTTCHPFGSQGKEQRMQGNGIALTLTLTFTKYVPVITTVIDGPRIGMNPAPGSRSTEGENNGNLNLCVFVVKT